LLNQEELADLAQAAADLKVVKAVDNLSNNVLKDNQLANKVAVK
jgi:hypothetical protein